MLSAEQISLLMCHPTLQLNQEANELVIKLCFGKPLNNNEMFTFLDYLKKEAKTLQQDMLDGINQPFGEHKKALANYRIYHLNNIYSVIQHYYKKLGDALCK